MHRNSCRCVKWKPNRAFTLIELLIVIAIVLILVAVAMPNFLEAMDRTRVARVKADMRTILTALESYRTDFRSYPPITGTFGNSFLGRLRPLTTPIPYLAELPRDPFGRDPDSYGGAHDQFPDPGDVYLFNTGAATFGGGVVDPESDLHDRYSIHSGGPDGLIDFPYYAFSVNFIIAQRHLVYVYSPTNGTRSAGDIIRRGGEIPNPVPGFGS